MTSCGKIAKYLTIAVVLGLSTGCASGSCQGEVNEIRDKFNKELGNAGDTLGVTLALVNAIFLLNDLKEGACSGTYNEDKVDKVKEAICEKAKNKAESMGDTNPNYALCGDDVGGPPSNSITSNIITYPAGSGNVVGYCEGGNC